jgi:hypothetical protein
MKLPPGNIFSGDDLRAVFTNPTEIAHWKGKLKHHYPIIFRGIKFADAEYAYKAFKIQAADRYQLCTEIIIAKLEQYPFLIETIKESGGEEWIKQCSHHVYNKSKFWEGDGLKSGFIKCLLAAYKDIKSRQVKIFK